MEEEIKATLSELEFYLKTHKELPLEKHKRGVDDCRHFQVVLDGEAHTVTCRQCHKKLDPFWYLCLLAGEWGVRRYSDAEAIAAYRKLKQQELNAEAKGKICVRPKETGNAQDVWDAFIAWKHKDPNYIFRRGNEWYVDAIEIRQSKEGEEYKDRITFGFSYIKMMLAGKEI